ncbi:sugar phosphate nucleotidyltransferase [Methylomonas sp. YC3]
MRAYAKTFIKPKPMVEIGGRPMLWHSMKIYSYHGINEFIICCGYKGYLIKEYFANYFLHMSNITFDMANNRMHVHENNAEPWRATFVDTGDYTATGGCLTRVRGYIKDEEYFCFTDGDGVSNVNIGAMIEFHKCQKTLATVTKTVPPAKFGDLDIDSERVNSFQEEPEGDNNMVNAGSLYYCRKSLITLTTTKLAGKGGRWKAWLNRDSWRYIDMTISGNRWTPYVRDKLQLEKL